MKIIGLEFMGFSIFGKEEMKYYLSLFFCQYMQVYLLGGLRIEATSKAEITKRILEKKSIFQKKTPRQSGHQGKPQDFVLYFLSNYFVIQ